MNESKPSERPHNPWKEICQNVWLGIEQIGYFFTTKYLHTRDLVGFMDDIEIAKGEQYNMHHRGDKPTVLLYNVVFHVGTRTHERLCQTKCCTCTSNMFEGIHFDTVLYRINMQCCMCVRCVCLLHADRSGLTIPSGIHGWVTNPVRGLCGIGKYERNIYKTQTTALKKENDKNKEKQTNKQIYTR